MAKPINLQISESAHKTLKDEAKKKGMKFYAMLENELEQKAKRIEKRNETIRTNK